MNKQRLEYVPGWMGGHYTLDGVRVGNWNRSGHIWVKGQKYLLITKQTKGKDDDHGHTYGWTRTDPGIMDGDVMPRFLSACELLRNPRIRIYIEWGDR